jgi:hypothetical protein
LPRQLRTIVALASQQSELRADTLELGRDTFSKEHNLSGPADQLVLLGAGLRRNQRQRRRAVGRMTVSQRSPEGRRESDARLKPS